MIAKSNILEIINNPDLGAVQLEVEYGKLNNDKQQIEFLSNLKEILKDCSDTEKAICFTLVDMIGKASDFQELVKREIENIKMTQSQSLINSLVWLAATFPEKWSMEFIHRVISYFKPQKDEYSYLYIMGMRSLVSTGLWREILSEIEWIIENITDIQVADFFAYFKWKRGESEYRELIQKIKDNTLLSERMKNLEDKIKERLINNYDKLIRN